MARWIGVRGRGTAGALAAVALVSACTAPVARSLEESEANTIVLALEEQGLGAEKEADPTSEGRFQVLVARDETSAAVAVLAQQGLPPAQSPGVLEALGPGGVVPSRAAEHAKLVAGKAGELERSLRSVDGVVSVRVHLAVPAPGNGFPGQATQKPSASVLLRHRGANPPVAPRDVQVLVAGAVEGLEADAVAVVATPAPTPPPLVDRGLARLGPVTVSRGSLGPLRLALGAATLLVLGLLGGVLALWARARRVEGELLEARGGATDAGPQ
ncbi:MAG: hypothetical protein IT376_23005 [Polyangiaceae bacterium]|nr:hypothetical protein [Polyangiaceae bacterium]